MDSHSSTAFATTWLSNGVMLKPLETSSVLNNWNYKGATCFCAAIG